MIEITLECLNELMNVILVISGDLHPSLLRGLVEIDIVPEIEL